jgi:hypothetical protein
MGPLPFELGDRGCAIGMNVSTRLSIAAVRSRDRARWVSIATAAASTMSTGARGDGGDYRALAASTPSRASADIALSAADCIALAREGFDTLLVVPAVPGSDAEYEAVVRVAIFRRVDDSNVGRGVHGECLLPHDPSNVTEHGVRLTPIGTLSPDAADSGP